MKTHEKVELQLHVFLAVQASRWPLTVDARIWSQHIPRNIYVKQSGPKAGFPQSISFCLVI